MNVEIYKGKHVVAESASNYIDVDSILQGYQELKEVANRMKNTGEKVVSTSDSFDNTNLFITGKKFDQSVKDCGDDITVSSQTLSDFADQILFEMNQALDKKQLELNREARLQDEEMEKQNSSKEVI